MRTYLPRIGPLGWVVCPGAGITHSQGIPPNFYPPHMNVGPPILHPHHLSMLHHISLPLQPSLCLHPSAWMNVASLNPWLLDGYTVQLSDSSGCYLI